MFYLKVNVFILNVFYDKCNILVFIYENKFIFIVNIKKILL